MTGHQIERLRPDGGLDDAAQEILARGQRPVLAAQADGLGGEADVGVRVQRARLVMGIELVVAGLEVAGVAPADLQGELAPGVVGVDRQEGVVEVEQREFPSFSSMERIRGMVMARLVCKA